MASDAVVVAVKPAQFRVRVDPHVEPPLRPFLIVEVVADIEHLNRRVIVEAGRHGDPCDRCGSSSDRRNNHHCSDAFRVEVHVLGRAGVGGRRQADASRSVPTEVSLQRCPYRCVRPVHANGAVAVTAP